MKSSVSGALLIDKQAGMTSHDVVDEVRRILKTRAVGHAGTLDPLATGLLVCLVGDATKLSQYVMSEQKIYRVGVRFGIRTDSGDITGKTIEEKNTAELKEARVREVVGALVGALELPVPKYSAVKIDGRKLYEYARAGEEVETPLKTMTIHSANVVDVALPERITVDLHCEKGTYVRSWVEKLGELLGVGATVETLRRLSSGPFQAGEGLSLDALKAVENPADKVVPTSEVLGGWPGLKVMGRDAVLIKNGQIPRSVYGQLLLASRTSGARILDENGGLLALIVADDRAGVKIARVFH